MIWTFEQSTDPNLTEEVFEKHWQQMLKDERIKSGEIDRILCAAKRLKPYSMLISHGDSGFYNPPFPYNQHSGKIIDGLGMGDTLTLIHSALPLVNSYKESQAQLGEIRELAIDIVNGADRTAELEEWLEKTRRK